MAGDTTSAALARRFAAANASLGQRLELEPGVAGVAFATLLPGMDHPQRSIALDDKSLKSDSTGLRVSSVRVSRDYFAALGASNSSPGMPIRSLPSALGTATFTAYTCVVRSSRV